MLFGRVDSEELELQVISNSCQKERTIKNAGRGGMGTGNMILEAEDRGYWEPSKNICLKHADNEIITKLITDNMSEAKCDYCETLGTEDEPVAAPLASLMDAIMVGINLFFEPAAESGVDTCEVDLTTKYDPHDVAHEVIDLLDSIYEPDRGCKFFH
ncbi:hypothetical protein ACNQRF_28850 [Mycolicibacterium peregrinum]